MTFERRRLIEPDNRKPIDSGDRSEFMRAGWQRAWFEENLTDGQSKQDLNTQTSFFNVFFFRRVAGSRHVVMAF